VKITAWYRGLHAGATDNRQFTPTDLFPAWNDDPKPFRWTKTAEEILDSLANYIARISGATPSRSVSKVL
jgi:hypothetical protein